MSIRRSLFAAAVIAAAGLSVFSPSEARADVDVNLYVGPSIGFFPGWAPGRRFITCGEGARLVDHRGFRQVRIVECGGRVARYRARREGIPWIVRVDLRRARIVSANPI